MKKISWPDEEEDFTISGGRVVLDRINFKDWWDREVEPLNEMIDKAVRLSSSCAYDKEYSYWCEYNDPSKVDDGNFTGWLIGKEPIKQETAEDILRAIVTHAEVAPIDNNWEYYLKNELIPKAKALLGEDK